MEMESCVRDWSGFPADMLGAIASRCNVLEDFMAFRGVCTSWRDAAPKKRFVCKVPLLMLAETDGSDEREFYSLSQKRICARIPVPGARGKRCLHVGFGWLLTLSSSGEACLLNPFSSARILLPEYTTFPDYEDHRMNQAVYCIRRAWLTADPSETLNFSLVVVIKYCVGFWRHGDLNWTSTYTYNPVATYLKGKIYMLDFKGHVVIWDAQDLSSTPEGISVEVTNAPTGHRRDSYD